MAVLDEAARERATVDTGVNLVVSAGAGTGKTSLLVERVLFAVGTGVVRLPEIAAITFTEKAAGELRHRVASGLEDLSAASRGGRPEDGPGLRAWRRIAARGVEPAAVADRAGVGLLALDRVVISTIHAFCADLIRAYPVESGLHPGFRVEGGAAAWRASEDEWNAFLAEELGPDGRRRDLWERVLGTVSLAETGEIARALIGGAVPDRLIAGPVASPDVRAAVGAAALACVGALTEAMAIDGVTPAPREWMEAAADVLRTFASAGAEDAREALLRSERLQAGTPELGARVRDRGRVEAARRRAGEWMRALRRLDEGAMADTVKAIVPFARRMRESLVRSGLIDFDDLLVRARDLLRDHPLVREAVKRRYRMLLLDEFQDTDPLQYEIVFFASEVPGESAAEAYAARLAPGRLFIVGDAKQSIYRFRGADYAAYRTAVGHVLGQGGAALSLTTNFRSRAAVLGPINALFLPPSPSWRPSDYLPDYEPIEAHRDDASAEPAVEVWTAQDGGPASAGERRRLEGRALARAVADLAGPEREVGYADVLVLFRAFSEVGPYLRAFRAAGIPFVVSGGRTFFERTEIVQAMALLRAVADPQDQPALLAYLRSPAGGVDDRELAVHAQSCAGDPWVAAVDARACPALADALLRLNGLRAIAARMPVDAAVRRVLEDSGLLTLSGLAFEAAQRVANLEKLALAAGTLARDGTLSLAETLDAIEDSLDFDEEGDSPLADETVDAVRVMTVHKAKGLEARVVFLADASAGQLHRQARRWKAGTVSIGGASYLRLAGPAVCNAAAFVASIDDPAHERAERMRLLYVAMTRARDRLIVFGGGTQATAWMDALMAWRYDRRLVPDDGADLAGGTVRHRLVGRAPEDERPAGRDARGALEAVDRYEAAVAAVGTLAAPPFRAPSGEDDRAPVDAEPGGLAPDRARAIGSLVHARLAGLPGAGADADVRREAEALLAAFEASPLAGRLGSLEVLGREVPVLLDDGDARYRGVIDLIYREPSGTIVVADYKTDASAAGVERHGPQLAAYGKAVERAMPGSTVRTEVWMLRTGEVIELPGQTSRR